MGRGKKAITIRDVARTAGVSVSTVSRVLNDKDDVAPETYEKVQIVIRRLGYTSSLAARSMRSRRTNVIGLIMPDVEFPFAIEVMKGVNRAITQHGYEFIVYTGGEIRNESTAERERRYISLLNSSITDGIILVTPATTHFSTASPVVVVDPNSQGPPCPAVIATNRAAALNVMEYLIGLGHRRIGFVTGRLGLESAVRRLEGYKDGLRQAGIAQDPDLIQIGDYTEKVGYACGQRLVSLANRPTAIFAANDQSALGVYRAVEEAGLEIPKDISVVGFDNIPEAAHAKPGLTTVDQFIDQMGRVAAEQLIDLIQGKAQESETRKMPTQLVVRDSCRALAAGAAEAQPSAAPRKAAK
jgi:LacI family transcriptional regulator